MEAGAMAGGLAVALLREEQLHGSIAFRDPCSKHGKVRQCIRDSIGMRGCKLSGVLATCGGAQVDAREAGGRGVVANEVAGMDCRRIEGCSMQL